MPPQNTIILPIDRVTNLQQFNSIIKLNNEQLLTIISSYLNSKEKLKILVKDGKISNLKIDNELVKVSSKKENNIELYSTLIDKKNSINLGNINYRINLINYRPDKEKSIDFKQIEYFRFKIGVIEHIIENFKDLVIDQEKLLKVFKDKSLIAEVLKEIKNPKNNRLNLADLLLVKSNANSYLEDYLTKLGYLKNEPLKLIINNNITDISTKKKLYKNDLKDDLKSKITNNVSNDDKTNILKNNKSNVKKDVKNDIKIDKNDVKTNVKTSVKPNVKTAAKTDVAPSVQSNATPTIKTNATSTVKTNVPPNVQRSGTSNVGSSSALNVKNQDSHKVKNNVKSNVKNSSPNLKDNVKISGKNDANNDKSEIKNEIKTEIRNEFKNELKSEIKNEVKNEIKEITNRIIKNEKISINSLSDDGYKSDDEDNINALQKNRIKKSFNEYQNSKLNVENNDNSRKQTKIQHDEDDNSHVNDDDKNNKRSSELKNGGIRKRKRTISDISNTSTASSITSFSNGLKESPISSYSEDEKEKEREMEREMERQKVINASTTNNKLVNLPKGPKLMVSLNSLDDVKNLILKFQENYKGYYELYKEIQNCQGNGNENVDYVNKLIKKFIQLHNELENWKWKIETFKIK